MTLLWKVFLADLAFGNKLQCVSFSLSNKKFYSTALCKHIDKLMLCTESSTVVPCIWLPLKKQTTFGRRKMSWQQTRFFCKLLLSPKAFLKMDALWDPNYSLELMTTWSLGGKEMDRGLLNSGNYQNNRFLLKYPIFSFYGKAEKGVWNN